MNALILFILFISAGIVFVKHCDAIALLYNVTTEEVINDTSRFVESYYSITCCRNGFPVPDPSLAPKIKEWTQQLVGSVEYGGNTTCHRYTGRYGVPYDWTTNNKDVTVGVRCQCPAEDKLDRNCRYLPECQNSGYRSFSINLRCVCPGQYFGELCEKYCLNGNLVKNSNLIDACQCQPFFYGDECHKVVCFNGGTAVNGRGCSCPTPYVGLHCDTRLNGSWDNAVPRNQDLLHRNLSGTAISLFLVLSLTLVSIYLIRRRRRLRRAILVANNQATLAAGGYHGNAPYPHQLVVEAAASYHHSNRGYEVDRYPPLPAYSDVVKSLPPAYHNNETVHSDNNVAMETDPGNSRLDTVSVVRTNPTQDSSTNVVHNR